MKRSPSATICASPLEDCSSSRSRPSSASHSRPVGAGQDRRGRVLRQRAGRQQVVGELDAGGHALDRGSVQRVVDGAVEGLGVGLGSAVERGLRDPRARGHGDEHGGDRHQAAGGCGAKSSHYVPVLRADFESSLTTSVKRAPSTSTRPPWRSAIARTIASPSPEPSPRACGPRWKRSKIRSGSVAARGPRPRRGRTPARRRRRRSRSRGPCPCLCALRTRLSTARSSAARSPSVQASRSITTSSARSASRTGSPCSDAAASSRASASRSSSSSPSRVRAGLDVGDRRPGRGRAWPGTRRSRAAR